MRNFKHLRSVPNNIAKKGGLGAGFGDEDQKAFSALMSLEPDRKRKKKRFAMLKNKSRKILEVMRVQFLRRVIIRSSQTESTFSFCRYVTSWTVGGLVLFQCIDVFIYHSSAVLVVK